MPPLKFWNKHPTDSNAPRSQRTRSERFDTSKASEIPRPRLVEDEPVILPLTDTSSPGYEDGRRRIIHNHPNSRSPLYLVPNDHSIIEGYDIPRFTTGPHTHKVEKKLGIFPFPLPDLSSSSYEKLGPGGVAEGRSNIHEVFFQGGQGHHITSRKSPMCFPIDEHDGDELLQLEETMIFDGSSFDEKSVPYGRGVAGGIRNPDLCLRRLLDLHLNSGNSTYVPKDYSSVPEVEIDMTFKQGTDIEEFDPDLWKQLALYALDYYNGSKGVKLELSGDVKAQPIFGLKVCGFHLFFEVVDEYGSAKQIFSEVHRFKSGDCSIKFCDIMDPITSDKGCLYCYPDVLHPKGFKFFDFPPIVGFV